MLPYYQEFFFNPSAAYRAAKGVRHSVEDAREKVAALIGAQAGEIIFTSCGTEASNAALACLGGKPLLAASEHPATRRTAAGGVVLPVLPSGLIDAEACARLMPACSGLSFAWANHETGVLQEVAALTAMAAGKPVHVDMVQAAGKVDIDVAAIPSLCYGSLSAHKLHGPKGVGALFVRTGTPYTPYLRGGMQEDGRRAGTENVAGIIGFAKAAEMALAARDTYAQLAGLRDHFEHELSAGLQEQGLALTIHGGEAPRLPHVSNVRIEHCTAESLTLLLEPAGLLCSSGSACTSAEPEPSHVLTAMGLSDAEARGALRFSLNRYSTLAEVDEALRLVLDTVRRVRAAQSSFTGPVMVYKP